MPSRSSVPIQFSHPVFHPSISSAPSPFFEAKSIYRFAFSVVAPCLPLFISQVLLPRCISHQIPIYFIGLIQDTSSTRLGSFKFSIVRELTRSTASSPININLHGVTNGVLVFTFIPESLPTNSV